MRQKVRRGSYRVFIGEGTERWSLGDPGHPLVSKANYDSRYNPTAMTDGQKLTLASITSDFAYLVHTCPTTKLACEKLAAMRAAVRELGDVEDEDMSPTRQEENEP
jgi:hypothetical protein